MMRKEDAPLLAYLGLLALLVLAQCTNSCAAEQAPRRVRGSPLT
jgi:hypothetical protein